ncbi:MAG: GNAT family N-acetyltransferase [Nitrososphaerales archaeon]
MHNQGVTEERLHRGKTTERLRIRNATIDDLPKLLDIYNYVVKTSAATFDIEAQTLEQKKLWFYDHGGGYPLIVGELDGSVIGYCSLSHFRDKPAYSKTVESSIYVDNMHQGRGFGKVLMTEILRRASDLGYHVVIAGIVGDNEMSVRLHLALGFQYIGCFKEVGYKFNKWQDVMFYQLSLSTT